MAASPLPVGVEQLLRERVDSFEALQLLLLVRAQPERWWTLDELSDASRLSSELTQAAIDALVLRELLERRTDGAQLWHFAPRGDDTRAAVDALERAYREQPIEIAKLLSANAIERVRSAAMHTFADAFVIGRRKKDG